MLFATEDELMRPDPYDDVDRDPTNDVEPVEFASDFCLELSVPFTPEQLTAISNLAREREIGPSEAAQALVEQALAARDVQQ
jgi:hypothetical protein